MAMLPTMMMIFPCRLFCAVQASAGQVKVARAAWAAAGKSPARSFRVRSWNRPQTADLSRADPSGRPAQPRTRWQCGSSLVTWMFFVKNTKWRQYTCLRISLSGPLWTADVVKVIIHYLEEAS